MPQIHPDDETVARPDDLRQERGAYDEIVTELINIYEAEEFALFHRGDEGYSSSGYASRTSAHLP